MRNADRWNMNWVAGLVVGYLCPDCQTPQEDLEAEFRFITDDYSQWRPLNTAGGTTTVVARIAESLAKTYPTPEIMRHKATQLEDARKNPQASQMVELMRAVADDMESGALWPWLDEASGSDDVG